MPLLRFTSFSPLVIRHLSLTVSHFCEIVKFHGIVIFL